jgi:hypothetical protein
MAKQYYPVGSPTYVELDSDLGQVKNTYFNNKNHFGFYFVDVFAPDFLSANPLLLKRVGNVSLAAVGNWSGWYPSPLLEYAIRLGYQITPRKAYLYKRGLIFSKYVNTLYNMRLQYPKGNPRNLICKLLLNSLYGRFGHSNFSRTSVTSTEIKNKIRALFSLQDEIRTLEDGLDNKNEVEAAVKAADLHAPLTSPAASCQLRRPEEEIFSYSINQAEVEVNPLAPSALRVSRRNKSTRG